MTAAELQITRAAFVTPASADEATRTVDLVIANEGVQSDQLKLICSKGAVTWGPAPVPVLLDHVNRTSSMAGRLIDVRIEPGRIVGRAQFTDAPAADEGWQLAKAGCAVSVGAYYSQADTAMQGPVEVVRRWQLREASLVPIGADPQALTRSAPSIQTITPDQTMTANIDQAADQTAADLGDAVELTAAEANRQLQITRSARLAGLSADEADQIITATAGQPVAAGLMKVIERHAQQVEGRAGGAGHPARIFTGTPGEATGLEATLTRAMKGERLDQPLWLTLRAAGIGHGGDAVSVWRSALAGEGRWLQRDLSTSDLPNLLTATGNRRLLERFGVAEAGIRMAASVRALADYRSASVIDVGQVGSAKVIKEGGEISFGAVDEVAASYKPSRYGLGLTFTAEALANDDLSGLDSALSELAAAMIDVEALALVDLLEGAANGRNAPDGKALFHADHNNTSTGGLTIATMGAAVQKLREQKSISGRYIAQEPAIVVCGTAAETTVRQLLSDAINAAQASNVNPWRNLQISVEPRLSGTYAYLLGDSRKPLELGRLTAGPVLTTDVKFETSAYRAKSEHVFGAIVQEHRSIVRIPTAA